jgi:hypothetical protein
MISDGTLSGAIGHTIDQNSEFLCKICRFFPRIGVLFGKKKYIK